MMKVIIQNASHGLGDFVLTTPAIKVYADYSGKPVPVIFQNRWIQEAYRDCEWMVPILSCNTPNILIGSGKKHISGVPINYVRMPAYYTAAKVIMEHLKTGDLPVPHTYIDACEEVELDLPERYCVMMRSVKEHRFAHEKVPDKEIYQKISDDLLHNGITPVWIGSENDRILHEGITGLLDQTKDNLRHLVAVIRGAEFVVGNTSGPYHIAMALKKPGFIMWKHQQFWQWQSPDPHHTTCHSLVYPDSNASTPTVGKWWNNFKQWNYGEFCEVIEWNGHVYERDQYGNVADYRRPNR